MSTRKQKAHRLASDAASELLCHMLVGDALTALLAVFLVGVAGALAWWVSR